MKDRASIKDCYIQMIGYVVLVTTYSEAIF